MGIKHSRPVPPFMRYCSAIIPTMFDDSLSYYEALCALNRFIQTNIVEVINNNAAVTEEYIKLVDELKEYVEHYFDNLDVQEEINNKLDEMVEDGTLQELIDEYLAVLTQTYIINDITFEKGEIDGTEYYITYVPHLDSEGEPIVIQHGFSGDNYTATATRTEDAREFALRKYATFCVNAGIFGVDDSEANYNHLMGTIIHDGQLVSTYDTDGYTPETQARMRLLGVKSDGSVGTYAINATYDSLIADNIVNTFSGFGTVMENSVITSPFPNDKNIWNFVCQNTTTKDLMFICCNGRDIQGQEGLTPTQLLNIAISKGYDYAFALDQGGSTTFVEQGIMVNEPYDNYGRVVRKVVDYIYFGKTPQTNVDFNIARVTADASDADINAKILKNKVTYLQNIDNNQLDYHFPNIRYTESNQSGVHLRYYKDNALTSQLIFSTNEKPNALALYDNVNNTTKFRADGDAKTIEVGGLTLADFFTKAQNITDYNDVTNSGIWRVGGNATHKPWAGTIGGICINLAGVSGGTRQIAIPQVSDSTSESWYTRSWNGTTWEAWKVMLTPSA